jgi:fumarate hydratase subunit beta
MNEVKKINTPLTADVVQSLKAGDQVEITGYIYTARDAAHAKMTTHYYEKGTLPVDLSDQIIYYVGPTPPKPGEIIGAAGPTTSGRMDAYAPTLLDNGLAGMIGKGYRNQDVIDAIVRNGSIYFAAVGGIGALLQQKIKSAEVIEYEELGTEAIRKLYVEDFPVLVVIDSLGNNLYKTGQEQYKVKEK